MIYHKAEVFVEFNLRIDIRRCLVHCKQGNICAFGHFDRATEFGRVILSLFLAAGGLRFSARLSNTLLNRGVQLRIVAFSYVRQVHAIGGMSAP